MKTPYNYPVAPDDPASIYANHLNSSLLDRLADGYDRVFRINSFPVLGAGILPKSDRVLFAAILPIATVVVWIFTGAIGLDQILISARPLFIRTFGWLDWYEKLVVIYGLIATAPFWIPPTFMISFGVAKLDWRSRTGAFFAGLSSMFGMFVVSMLLAISLFTSIALIL